MDSGVCLMDLGTWLGVPFGLVCMLVGVFHIGMFLGGRSGLAPAAANAVMGIGMAAMFVPAADPVPRPVWVAAFLVVAAWSAAACLRARSLCGEAGHHTIGAVAMLVMLSGHAHGAAGTPGAVDPGHAHDGGGAGAGEPLLQSAVALALAAWFLADITRRVVRASTDLALAGVPEGAGARTATRGPAWSRPVTVRRDAAPHVVMSAAMTVMVLGMV